jgi:hypothetical protein
MRKHNQVSFNVVDLSEGPLTQATPTSPRYPSFSVDLHVGEWLFVGGQMTKKADRMNSAGNISLMRDYDGSKRISIPGVDGYCGEFRSVMNDYGRIDVLYLNKENDLADKKFEPYLSGPRDGFFDKLADRIRCGVPEVRNVARRNAAFQRRQPMKIFSGEYIERDDVVSIRLDRC